MPSTETEKRPLRIRVTKTDLRRGKRRECFECAVALALQRATNDPEAHIVEVDWQLRAAAHCRLCPLPWDVSRVVRDFDDGAEVEPFTFTLPDFSDPEWQEQCRDCEGLRDASELDEEGYCDECRD